jgi:hypothetical protein
MAGKNIDKIVNLILHDVVYLLNKAIDKFFMRKIKFMYKVNPDKCNAYSD